MFKPIVMYIMAVVFSLILAPMAVAILPGLQNYYQLECYKAGAAQYSVYEYGQSTGIWANIDGPDVVSSSNRTEIIFHSDDRVISYFGSYGAAYLNQTDGRIAIPDLPQEYPEDRNTVVFCVGPPVPVASDVCTPGEQRGVNASLCCRKLYNGNVAGIFALGDGGWFYTDPSPPDIEGTTNGTVFQYTSSVPVTMLDSQTAYFNPSSPYSGTIDGVDRIWMCEDNRITEEIPEFHNVLLVAFAALAVMGISIATKEAKK